jgi:cytochrome c556
MTKRGKYANPNRILLLLVAAVGGLIVADRAVGQERRARPPQFEAGDFRGVFYDDVTKVVTSDRPRIDQLGNTKPTPPTAASVDASPTPSETAGQGGGWRSLVDPVDLEDEVKRVKLAYDSLVTTPGRFKSGDYRDARSRMFVLATLLAVVSEYDGEVRFKEDAAIARDLISRSAINLTGDAFADAKQRKADLQDLVSGGGMARTAPTGPTDWSNVATRSALMDYLERMMNQTLRGGANDAASVSENLDDLRRAASMVAIVGEVLNKPGMDESDDADYRALSSAMTAAALKLKAALARDDAEAARLAVGDIGQSCSACHEQYR